MGQLTNWGRVRYICFSKLNIVGSDNALSPRAWRPAILWTNAGILSMWYLRTNFGEKLIEVRTLSLKMHLTNVVCKVAAILARPRCVNNIMLVFQDAMYKRSCTFSLRLSIILRRHLLHPDPKPNSYWHNNVEHISPMYIKTTGTPKHKEGRTKLLHINMKIHMKYSRHEQYILPAGDLVSGTLMGSNPACNRGRQLVPFRFEYRLPVPEHRN